MTSMMNKDDWIESEEEESFYSATESLDWEGYEAPEDLPNGQYTPIKDYQWDEHLLKYGMSWDLRTDLCRILIIIGRLPRMAHTVRRKNWFSSTVEVVGWLVMQRHDSLGFDLLDPVQRKEAVRTQQIKTACYLFGGPFCQVGKTYVAAVTTVVAAHFNACHLVTTYTASTNVPDLQQKIKEYLRIRDPIDGEEDVETNFFCPVKTFPRASPTTLGKLAQDLKRTYVISFNSPHQLGTAAAVRVALATQAKVFGGGTSSAARPFVTADEVDQVIRSPDRSRLTEIYFDAVLGMHDRKVKFGASSDRTNSISARKVIAMCPGFDLSKTYRLGPVTGVVATTSTCVSFLSQLVLDFGWDLSGWVMPQTWENYAGLEHYLPQHVKDNALNKGNMYMFDEEGKAVQMVDRAIALGKNQVVHVGNVYVRAAGGLYDMAQRLYGEVAQPHKLCCVLIHGSGRAIKLHDSDWVELSNKVTVESTLQQARAAIGDGTIFVCGTVISRGMSILSNIGEFLCPLSAVIMATPLGRNLEEYYQAINRGTGDFLGSLGQIGQVHPLTGRPCVELLSTEADWRGSIAYPAFTSSLYRDFRSGKSIKEALLTPKDGEEDFLAAFRSNRVVSARSRNGQVRKCQGNVQTRIIRKTDLCLRRLRRQSTPPAGRSDANKRRFQIFMQALAIWVRQNPGKSEVTRQEILNMHPSLCGGNNHSAKVCFQRQILECHRLGGPRSGGTGVWTVTEHGKRLLASVEISAEDFAAYM